MKKIGYEKHRDYEQFIGDYVTIYVRDILMTDKDINGQDTVASAINAYIVDVTPSSLIIGEDPGNAYGIIPLDILGPVILSQEISESLKFPTPPIEEQN